MKQCAVLCAFLALLVVATLNGFGDSPDDSKTKSPPDWFRMDDVDVIPFSTVERIRILVGVRGEASDELYVVFMSDIRLHVAGGKVRFRVPKEYGGEVEVQIPHLSSTGSACRICGKQGEFCRWLRDRHTGKSGVPG